jgi:hypothetical protein
MTPRASMRVGGLEQLAAPDGVLDVKLDEVLRLDAV